MPNGFALATRAHGTRFALLLALVVAVATCGGGSDESADQGVQRAPTLAPNGRLSTLGVRSEAIGRSVQGRIIEAATVGSGDRTLVVLGGIHTGNEAETVDLVMELLEEFSAQPGLIPGRTRIVFIPNSNPDGYASESRTNANGVDLNRNWPSADWAEVAMHGDAEVFGGEAPLSEPETDSLFTFLRDLEPDFILSFHGYAGLVQYNSAAGAEDLGKLFAEEAEYEAIEEWTFYEITGELIQAMADLDIPAADVELIEFDDESFERARAGIQAVLKALD